MAVGIAATSISRARHEVTVIFGRSPPGINDIVRIARHREAIAIGAELAARLAAGRVVVDRSTAANEPVYGLTTGLGAGVDTRLAVEDLAAFQMRIPLGRSVGVGAPLSTERVRAMMAARLAGMAAGGSGVSPHVFDSLVAALNAGFHPVVPALASIGAADLAPLAHMGAALIGVGEAEVGGTVYPAPEALRIAGLKPLVLGPKDGHALVVANSLSVGHAALLLHDLDHLVEWALCAVALSFEGFRANVGALDARAIAARPAFGQEAVAGRLRALLAESRLYDQDAARRLQDPLSYRCVPQVWGAASHALDLARAATEIELASSGDNPVVLADDGVILSHGNFDMTAFALTFEQVGQALAHTANMSAQRAMKLMSASLSGLPRFLTPIGGNRAGFAALQKTIAALDAEIRHLALPISLGTVPVADGIEDVASMAPSVVAKTGEIAERLNLLTAIELIVAAQAIDLRGVVGLGTGARTAYDTVRAEVAKLEDDRPLGVDVMRLARRIGANGLSA
jgi:histidine ammonia-lyase